MKFLRRRIGHVLSILTLAALLGSSYPHAQTKPSQAEKQQPVTTPKSDAERGAINIQITNGDQHSGPAEHTNSQYSDSWTKWSTVAVAAFTFGLLVIAGLQWSTLKRQADLMGEQLEVIKSEVGATKDIAESTRTTLLFAHRPELIIRHIVVKGIDEGVISDRLYGGYAWATNIGPLPVTVVGFKAKWLFREKLPIENELLTAATAIDPHEVAASKFVKLFMPDVELPGIAEHAQVWSDDADAERMNSQNERAKKLFLIGVLKYTDKIGTRRRFFCYRFSFRKHRFEPQDHPNYNYTD